ncbi:CRISPR-associated protein Cmr4 [Lewinella aquimaris]|uniref:CRISPR-associated protein Cmr4 n=1 Tax=Neolewinella aquimaris TaxID=1835722 RepID=A0A840E3Z2_9BACT|nr:type III-B CRISPR module RAMP protein Cmr4 [Neolewinella aquimaris]MBB4080314.1 CRISPR-associated protein Cmr4 [Neolewinella aquimaris]
MKHTQIYLLRALTNLHPGAGDANFGIIDKHVQRDSVTDLPTIFASSIKGSLRELFESGNANSANVLTIFGGGADGKAQVEALAGEHNDEAGAEQPNPTGKPTAARQPAQGNYIFYEAKLIALPIRSDRDLYYLATTPPLVQEMLDDCELHGVTPEGMEGLRQIAEMGRSVRKGEPKYFGEDRGKVQLEEHQGHQASSALEDETALESIFGKRLAVLHVDDFQRLAKELPTVARNSLNNGISVNLWYEEIVPRETRFYCPVTAMVEEQDLLEAGLASHNHLVQIGGNATVGQGLCKWIKL